MDPLNPRFMSPVFGMSSPVEKLFLFYGMRRTGNHALIYWMLGQFDLPYWYSNDNKWPWKTLSDVIYATGGKPLKTAYAHGISTFEDIPYRDTGDVLGAVPKVVSHARAVQEVLILRDPFNLFSSRRHGKFCSSPCDKASIELWKTYARLFLEPLSRMVCVRYDEWFLHEHYRRAVSAQLGLKFNDLNLNYVPREGKGSSFDHRDFSDRAQQMKVLERWKMSVHDPEWMALFDRETVQLAKRVFNFVPEPWQRML